MQISIANAVPPEAVAHARSVLAKAAFTDGRATAGWAVREVKDNAQAGPAPQVNALRETLAAQIIANPVFALAVRPKRLVSLVFAKYGPGQAYGAHVDNALMEGVRTDVAFTLFLADPASYEGGELVIEQAAGDDAVKLAAGSLLAYPATSLHRVAPVTRGERLVMVGWVRSYIRDAGKRELLFDLDTARRRLFDAQGKTAEVDLLSKCCANLLREWVED